MAIQSDKTNSVHYTWGNNCDSWILTDGDDLSVKLESMPPGTRETLHFHSNAKQFFFILNGEANFFIGDEQIKVIAQQGILIHPGAKHFISNDSNEKLEFLVISQPSTSKDRTEVKNSSI